MKTTVPTHKTTAFPLAATSFALCALIVTSLPASAEDQNLAEGIVGITESISASQNVSVKNLTDNNDYTVWKAPTPVKVDFDLGEVKRISRVELHIPPQYLTVRNQELSMEVSQDGETFEEVVEPQSRAFTNGNQGRVTLPIDKEARYLRILIESNDQDDGEAMLSEVRIF